MVNDDIIIYAVGDVAPSSENPKGYSSIFEHVKPALNQGDIVFCQLEINLSTRGSKPSLVGSTPCADPEAARAIKDTGFTVVSFAGNHCMDWGREAFFDTIDALKKQGLAVVGVGSNIEEARRPVIIECKGTRIAFLAYNSILPNGYWAETNKPGCAPLRAWTLYEQVQRTQPGTHCKIHTFPHRDDLKAMVDDIKKAKSEADLVILSMHWGIHFVPAVLAEYQTEVAHIAIDSGADLIIGHHAHILKGTEVYANKAIFYSLCNFAFELPFPKELAESPEFKAIQEVNPDYKYDPEYPTYTFPPDSRKTIIAKCTISNKSIKRVSFLPAYINKQAQPEILTSNDIRFGQVVKYMKKITKSAELNTKYTVDGDEVIIHK
jgi:poly-gamma-glutamate capsule biosynthesis protein CapA/YwtB (metallophosphatase superfamily)